MNIVQFSINCFSVKSVKRRLEMKVRCSEEVRAGPAKALASDWSFGDHVLG